VTRGTRPKKPSSSRSFAREARGAQGSWRLKTENQNFFFSFPAGNNYQKNILFYFLNIRADSACQRGRKAGGGKGGRERREGEEGGRGGRGKKGKEGLAVSKRTDFYQRMYFLPSTQMIKTRP
jgi:hypothetical protein